MHVKLSFSLEEFRFMYGQRHCVASYKKNAQWANHFTCRRVDVANRKSLRRPTLSSTQTLVSQILTEYNVALFSLWYSLLPLSLDCDGINLCFPILFKVLLYAMCAVKVQIVYTALQYYHISPQYLQLVVDFLHFTFIDFFLQRLLSETSSKILLFSAQSLNYLDIDWIPTGQKN